MRDLPQNQQIWEELKKRCILGLELDDGKFNIAENVAERSCLGTAVGSEERAVSLVLVGMDDEAETYFSKIRELGLLAFENDETYVYDGPDGGRSFAKYMAMRLVSTAEWMLSGVNRDDYRRTMIVYLERAISNETAWRGSSSLDSRELGPLLMHLAQIGRWTDLQNSYLVHKGRGRRRGIWSNIVQSAVGLAEDPSPRSKPNEWRAAVDFDRLFRTIVDVSRHKAPHARDLTSNDVVGLAEIRAKWIYSTDDPIATVKSIRWPELMGTLGTG